MHAFNSSVFIVITWLGNKLHQQSTFVFDMILQAIMKSVRHVELACSLPQLYELPNLWWILIAQLHNRSKQ